jgi:hypothetical protein
MIVGLVLTLGTVYLHVQTNTNMAITYVSSVLLLTVLSIYLKNWRYFEVFCEMFPLAAYIFAQTNTYFAIIYALSILLLVVFSDHLKGNWRLLEVLCGMFPLFWYVWVTSPTVSIVRMTGFNVILIWCLLKIE